MAPNSARIAHVAEEVEPTAPVGVAKDFEWSNIAEPHATRKAIILKRNANARHLAGADPMLKWKVTVAVLTQVVMAYLVSGMSWPLVIALAYTLGGTINHAMTLGMHEVSHSLAFRSYQANRWFGYFTNLPLGIPAFASFQRYHREHHQFQGEDGVDADIPTAVEGRIFLQGSAVRKLLWVFLQPAFYALRPMLVMTKRLTMLEYANIAVQVAFDAAIYYAFGLKGLSYLIVGTLLGMGLHPMAGHFVAEHYTFLTGQETYSYYGPLNWFSFNVGYHNEHHDMATVPGSRLPKLREMVPEMYDALPHHYSWVMVLLRYITNPHVGPFSRVKRATLSEETIRGIQEDSNGSTAPEKSA